MSLTAWWLGLVMIASQAAPIGVAVLPVRGTGLSAEVANDVTGRLTDEIKLLGGEAKLAEAPPDAACLEDESCRAQLAVESVALVDVEMVRFGPDLQITARLFDATGAELSRAEHTVTAEGFRMSGTLLGDDLAAELRSLIAASRSEKAPGPMADAPSDGAGVDSGGSPSIAFISLVSAGGALAVFGGVSALGGLVAYLGSQGTLYTPSSPGSQKDLAIVGRVVGAGVLTVGVVLFLAGAVTAGTAGAL